MDNITLAIDGSTTATGWAFRDSKGIIHHGVITAPEDEKNPVTRSRYIADILQEIVHDYNVVNLMIEKPISKGKINTTISLAWSNGIIIGSIPHDYTINPLPGEWRSWYGLKTEKQKGQSVRDDWKTAAIKEVQRLGFDISIKKIVYKGKPNERIELSDDEAEAILILLAAERKGM